MLNKITNLHNNSQICTMKSQICTINHRSEQYNHKSAQNKQQFHSFLLHSLRSIYFIILANMSAVVIICGSALTPFYQEHQCKSVLCQALKSLSSLPACLSNVATIELRLSGRKSVFLTDYGQVTSYCTS